MEKTHHTKSGCNQAPTREQLFKETTDEMFGTYQKKNADYGNSFSNSMKEFGLLSAVVRINDKVERLKSITKSGRIEVKDESVKDTLKDLANYAIMTLIELELNEQQ